MISVLCLMIWVYDMGRWQEMAEIYGTSQVTDIAPSIPYIHTRDLIGTDVHVAMVTMLKTYNTTPYHSINLQYYTLPLYKPSTQLNIPSNNQPSNHHRQPIGQFSSYLRTS